MKHTANNILDIASCLVEEKDVVKMFMEDNENFRTINLDHNQL